MDLAYLAVRAPRGKWELKVAVSMKWDACQMVSEEASESVVKMDRILSQRLLDVPVVAILVCKLLNRTATDAMAQNRIWKLSSMEEDDDQRSFHLMLNAPADMMLATCHVLKG